MADQEATVLDGNSSPGRFLALLANLPGAGARPWVLFDPRRYLAAAIGWAVLITGMVAGLLAASLAANTAERRVREGSERMLTQLAAQTQNTLSGSLANRLSIVQATAAHIEAANDSSAERLRAYLSAVQLQFPEFAWLGLADMNGKVVAATGRLLERQDVSARPSFKEGAAGPWLGDIHKALLLEKHLPPQPDGQPLRFVDAAVPLRDAAGRPLVLGSHLSWHWVEGLQREATAALDAHEHIDLMLVAGDGTVVTGPPAWLGRSLTQADVDLTEGGLYLARSVGASLKPGRPGLEWSVVVRQHRDAATAAAAEVARRVFMTVLVAAVLASALAIAATLMLTRKLSRLAAQARRLQDGAVSSVDLVEGRDEIARIGATLAAAVMQLQTEKTALKNLNTDLDAKVEARTREIARLAEENQQLALVRERLRLARDVHDSLANSLLALLNEIRLIRMLHEKGRASDLLARLGAAEEAADRGLQEARASITQMRHNNLAQVGLANALQDLLARVGNRCGIEVSLVADPAAAEIPRGEAEVIFRIAEEALRNVERHAAARSASIDVAFKKEGAVLQVSVVIRDDGKGFDTAVHKHGHYGLQGLYELAASIGGKLRIDSQPGSGTCVELRLPFGAHAMPAAFPASGPASPAKFDVRSAG